MKLAQQDRRVLPEKQDLLEPPGHKVNKVQPEQPVHRDKLAKLARPAQLAPKVKTAKLVPPGRKV